MSYSLRSRQVPKAPQEKDVDFAETLQAARRALRTRHREKQETVVPQAVRYPVRKDDAPAIVQEQPKDTPKAVRPPLRKDDARACQKPPKDTPKAVGPFVRKGIARGAAAKELPDDEAEVVRAPRRKEPAPAVVQEQPATPQFGRPALRKVPVRDDVAVADEPASEAKVHEPFGMVLRSANRPKMLNVDPAASAKNTPKGVPQKEKECVLRSAAKEDTTPLNKERALKVETGMLSGKKKSTAVASSAVPEKIARSDARGNDINQKDVHEKVVVAPLKTGKVVAPVGKDQDSDERNFEDIIRRFGGRKLKTWQKPAQASVHKMNLRGNAQVIMNTHDCSNPAPTGTALPTSETVNKLPNLLQKDVPADSGNDLDEKPDGVDETKGQIENPSSPVASEGNATFFMDHTQFPDDDSVNVTPNKGGRASSVLPPLSATVETEEEPRAPVNGTTIEDCPVVSPNCEDHFDFETEHRDLVEMRTALIDSGVADESLPNVSPVSCGRAVAPIGSSALRREFSSQRTGQSASKDPKGDDKSQLLPNLAKKHESATYAASIERNVEQTPHPVPMTIAQRVAQLNNHISSRKQRAAFSPIMTSTPLPSRLNVKPITNIVDRVTSKSVTPEGAAAPAVKSLPAVNILPSLTKSRPKPPTRSKPTRAAGCPSSCVVMDPHNLDEKRSTLGVANSAADGKGSLVSHNDDRFIGCALPKSSSTTTVSHVSHQPSKHPRRLDIGNFANILSEKLLKGPPQFRKSDASKMDSTATNVTDKTAARVGPGSSTTVNGNDSSVSNLPSLTKSRPKPANRRMPMVNVGCAAIVNHVVKDRHNSVENTNTMVTANSGNTSSDTRTKPANICKSSEGKADKGLFDSDSDDGLFGRTNQKSSPDEKAMPPKKALSKENAVGILFEDDDE